MTARCVRIVPFRNEDELMEEGESAEDAFNRHMEHKKNSHTARGGGQKKS